MVSAARPGGSLPIAVTSFVGRRREIADVRRRLSESRLVTLTGVGGVGKTRLAVEVAEQSRRAFGGRVWMVDLSAVADGARVPQAAVSALGLVDRSTLPPVEKLVDHLSGADTLILLDNCEHLPEACAQLVAELLHRTGRVRVLATSRQPLGITGEYLFPVPPLSVPDPQRVPNAAALGQYEAVQLLLDRAAALRPGFGITETNRIAAARLCAQLDGLPLAIELAATRLRSLSLVQLVDRLGGRFALLTVGSRDAQPRQQTLRALIDWSYSLCSPEERRLWARLSVFAGPFDLAAAEGVCGEGALSGSVLDLLDRLVAQSIAISESEGDGLRFRLLETIRQYGRERLVELGEQDVLRLRHRDFYLARAQRTCAAWCGPGQQADLEQLRADHGNLRAALDLALTDPDSAGPALALTAALRNHWCVDGYLGEGRRWLDRALELPGQVPAARATALWVAAWVCLLQGDAEVACARLDECDALAARLGDTEAAGFARSLRGTATLFAGRLDEAIADFDAALAVFRAGGYPVGELWALFQLGISLAHAGDGARADEVCRESLALCEAHGERLCRSYTLWVLGFNTWRHGDPAVAAAVTRQGLEVQRGFRDPIGAALMIELLAWIAASRADFPAAAGLLGAAGAVWADIGTTLHAFGPPLDNHQAACERQLRAALGDRGFQAGY
ncbi:MAG TPA: NB-ARC domain-containing protein, partial [Rugosimonospora sp.]|nr:NB-ARC domain-containing protein [Rugosimonospora sp.]